jgi:hypothetical protein
MPRLAGQEQEPAIFVGHASPERERPVILPRQAGREGETRIGFVEREGDDPIPESPLLFIHSHGSSSL